MPNNDSGGSDCGSHHSSTRSPSRSPSGSVSQSPSRSDSQTSLHDAKSPTAHRAGGQQPNRNNERLEPRSPPGNESPEGEVHRLKQSNEQLRQKLMQLNSQLDFELAQRGKAGAIRHGRIDEQKLSKLRAQVDELRRENETLKRQVYQADGISRVTDLHNQVLQKEQEIERLRESTRGLENVQRNQSKKMEVVSQIESERARIRSAHNEELRALKDHLRSLKEAREQDEKTVKKLQGQINQMEDKINLAKGLKTSTTIRSLKEAEKLIADKETKVQTLTETVEKLQKQIENERKRAGQRITEKDVEQLRATLLALKAQVAEKEKQVRRAEKTAASVPADTVGEGGTAVHVHAAAAKPLLRPPPAAPAAKAGATEDVGADDKSSSSEGGSAGSEDSDEDKKSDDTESDQAEDEAADSDADGSQPSSPSGDKEASSPIAPPQQPPIPSLSSAPAFQPSAPSPEPNSGQQNPHNPFGFVRKRRGS